MKLETLSQVLKAIKDTEAEKLVDEEGTLRDNSCIEYIRSSWYKMYIIGGFILEFRYSSRERFKLVQATRVTNLGV